MKTKVSFCLITSFIFLVVYPSFSQKDTYSTKWANGFKYQSADKEFKLKFGGRLMVDHAFFFQDEDLDHSFNKLKSSNGTEFRRARFYSSGTIYSNVSYKLQLDFTGGKVAMKDAFIKIKRIPIIGSFTVGHFKEPLRFDVLTSSKYITFMERALLTAFSQERNNGFMIANDIFNKKLSFQAGLFRAADKYGNDKDANDGYAITTRVTGSVFNKEAHALHLGTSYSYRKPNLGLYKINSRPEAHLSEWQYLKTGDIVEVQKINIFNFELVYILNSISIQSEYLISNLYTLTEGIQLYSYYSQLSYFLTGESKKIKSSYAAFGRVKPKHNFGKEGIGAWELALRYSYANLNHKSVNGGEQADLTLGLNWYLNPATKIMFNYIHGNIIDKGKINIFQTRFQVDF